MLIFEVLICCLSSPVTPWTARGCRGPILSRILTDSKDILSSIPMNGKGVLESYSTPAPAICKGVLESYSLGLSSADWDFEQCWLRLWAVLTETLSSAECWLGVWAVLSGALTSAKWKFDKCCLAVSVGLQEPWTQVCGKEERVRKTRGQRQGLNNGRENRKRLAEFSVYDWG